MKSCATKPLLPWDSVIVFYPLIIKKLVLGFCIQTALCKIYKHLSKLVHRLHKYGKIAFTDVHVQCCANYHNITISEIIQIGIQVKQLVKKYPCRIQISQNKI